MTSRHQPSPHHRHRRSAADKRRFPLALVICLALGAAFLSAVFWRHGERMETTQDRQNVAPAAPPLAAAAKVEATTTGGVIAVFTVRERFGVAHPEQIIDFDLDKKVDASNCVMLGPDGKETGFQIIEGGKKIAVRTRLPASRLAQRALDVYDRGIPPPPGLENHLRLSAPLAEGQVVRFYGGGLPPGIEPDTDYFAVAARQDEKIGNWAAFARAPGGAPLSISDQGNVNAYKVVPLALAAIVEQNRIYAPGHGLRNNEPVRFWSREALPAPLAADAIYRVQNADANSFQVSPDGKPGSEVIRLTSAGRGQQEMHIEWTWRLMTGRPSAVCDDAVKVEEKKNLRCLEIVNGLTGVRIPLPADIQGGAVPAPVQGIRLRDGTWTACGPNFLNADARLDKLIIDFLERGPLKVVVLLSYSGYRDAETRDARHGKVEIPAGARYRGHYATAKEFGYEKDGRQYRMGHERLPMDAFYDLRFDRDRISSYVSGSESICRMARWDPWISNSGWYWQIYNKNADDNANLLGIFAGPASRMLGCGNSGTGLFTMPLGVRDLDTAADDHGNVHAVFQSANTLWYVRFDKNLKVGGLVKIADGLANANLLVRENGSLSVAAYDTAAAAFVLLESADSTSFERSTVFLEADGGAVKIADPYPYQAETGGRHFLFCYGAWHGKDAGLLFARQPGGSRFALQQSIPLCGYYRRICRPAFGRLPDGSAVWAGDFGQYAVRLTLGKGETKFSEPLGRLPSAPLTFGAAFDQQTGAVYVGNQEGAVAELTPGAQEWRYTRLGLAVDHVGQGPNRCSAASSPSGETVFAHGGRAFWRNKRGEWSELAAVNNLDLANLRVHYHAPSSRFIFMGRRDGKLALVVWWAGEKETAVLADLSATAIPAAGLSIQINRGSPDASFWKQVRYSWGLFTGLKRDLADPYEYQPIAKQMSLRAGVNLNKIHRLTVSFPDPPKGYGSLYMDGKVIRKMIEKLRADPEGPHGNGYHAYLYRVEPSARGLVDMWKDTSGREMERLADGLQEETRSLLNGLVNEDGIYTPRCGYWHGGLAMSRQLMWIDQIMASDLATPEMKSRAKAAAALFAAILWDDDFVPLFDGHGVNLGTANMPVQQANYRAMYAIYLAAHPAMKPRAQSAWEQARAMIQSTMNEWGAHMAGVHYIDASNGPLCSTLQQLKMAGIADAFKSEARLAKFAEFYMNFLTPPEPRFGNMRKLVAIGDSSTANTAAYGQMATGFADANPELSARLMGAWQENGKVHSGFHGTTLLKIDESLPSASPNLGDASFPGWCSTLRHGWGTACETALWFINGDFQRDHRHCDAGSLVLYALQAPLIVDWGSIYYPRVAGGFAHSMVQMESKIGHPWDKDSPPLNTGHDWRQASQERFLSFAGCGLTSGSHLADNLKWTRTIVIIRTQEEFPAILIEDAFDSEGEDQPKVATFNLMASGQVETPVGAMTPEPRIWGYRQNQGDKQQLPSAGSLFVLKPGPNRLRFTGEIWQAHPAQGIDWDMWLIPREEQQAMIGNWAHAWHPEGEMAQFSSANGRPFEERQHILRVRGTGVFTTLILPYAKTARRETMVKQNKESLQIITAGEAIAIDKQGYSFKSDRRVAVGSFSAARVADHGIAIEGGPAEVMMAAGKMVISVHGPTGKRLFQLPGDWQAAEPLKREGEKWAFAYEEGPPQRVTLLK